MTHGAGSQIHIFGRVKSSWGGSDEQVKQIAANPPIEQTGNIVRIGARHENLHNISIDYEIQAPADAYLNAGSGSGEVNDDGVGENAKLSTGSGNIHATGLHGGFTVDTGSGNIYAEQTGRRRREGRDRFGHHRAAQPARRAEGRDRIGQHQGGRNAGRAWKLETGSGSVELWTGNAALTLDAETGSGSIHSDREMTTQGSSNRAPPLTGKIAAAARRCGSRPARAAFGCTRNSEQRTVNSARFSVDEYQPRSGELSNAMNPSWSCVRARL